MEDLQHRPVNLEEPARQERPLVLQANKLKQKLLNFQKNLNKDLVLLRRE